MIDLRLEPYCDNCTDFTPEVERFYADDKVYQTMIYCQYRERCRRIYDTIVKEIRNETR